MAKDGTSIDDLPEEVIIDDLPENEMKDLIDKCVESFKAEVMQTVYSGKPVVAGFSFCVLSQSDILIATVNFEDEWIGGVIMFTPGISNYMDMFRFSDKRSFFSLI